LFAVQNSLSHTHNSKQPTNKKKVLILSKDTQLALSLSLFFAEEFEVQTVEQFDHAGDIIGQDDADLLLIDYGMPDDHIPKSLSSIRRRKNIPIVMMYVFHEKKMSIESEIRKYTDAVFYKPVNILDVLGKIRLCLS